MVRQITRRGPTKRGGGKKHKAKPRTPKVNMPAKTKPDKMDPTVASEALHRIKEAESDLASSEAKYNDAKVTAREAKASMEKKRKRLHEIIAEEVGSIPSLYSAKTQAAVEEGNEPWRKEPISGLDLNAGTVAKLAAEHITNIGEYCDYLKPQTNGFQPRLQDIKGLGPKAITAIEDAMEKFWAEWKEKESARAQEAKGIIEDVADSTVMPAAEAKPSSNGDGEHEEIESEEGDE